MEKDLGSEGNRKRLRHMVTVQSLWWKLKEHTVASEVIAYRLLRRIVEPLQERMMCRAAKLEARAEDMRNTVTRKVEMALIRYNQHVTAMEVRPQPDWQVTQVEGAMEATEADTDEQQERMRAGRRKRVQQV